MDTTTLTDPESENKADKAKTLPSANTQGNRGDQPQVGSHTSILRKTLKSGSSKIPRSGGTNPNGYNPGPTEVIVCSPRLRRSVYQSFSRLLISLSQGYPTVLLRTAFLCLFSEKDRVLSSPVTMELTIDARHQKHFSLTDWLTSLVPFSGPGLSQTCQRVGDCDKKFLRRKNYTKQFNSNYVAETDNEDTDTIERTETEASSNNHESEAHFDVRDTEMMPNNCIQGELRSNRDDATFDNQMPPWRTTDDTGRHRRHQPEADDLDSSTRAQFRAATSGLFLRHLFSFNTIQFIMNA